MKHMQQVVKQRGIQYLLVFGFLLAACSGGESGDGNRNVAPQEGRGGADSSVATSDGNVPHSGISSLTPASLPDLVAIVSEIHAAARRKGPEVGAIRQQIEVLISRSPAQLRSAFESGARPFTDYVDAKLKVESHQAALLDAESGLAELTKKKIFHVTGTVATKFGENEYAFLLSKNAGLKKVVLKTVSATRFGSDQKFKGFVEYAGTQDMVDTLSGVETTWEVYAEVPNYAADRADGVQAVNTASVNLEQATSHAKQISLSFVLVEWGRVFVLTATRAIAEDARRSGKVAMVDDSVAALAKDLIQRAPTKEGAEKARGVYLFTLHAEDLDSDLISRFRDMMKELTAAATTPDDLAEVRSSFVNLGIDEELIETLDNRFSEIAADAISAAKNGMGILAARRLYAGTTHDTKLDDLADDRFAVFARDGIGSAADTEAVEAARALYAGKRHADSLNKLADGRNSELVAIAVRNADTPDAVAEAREAYKGRSNTEELDSLAKERNEEIDEDDDALFRDILASSSGSPNSLQDANAQIAIFQGYIQRAYGKHADKARKRIEELIDLREPMLTNVANFKEAESFGNYGTNANALSFSGDGSRFAVSGYFPQVVVWDISGDVAATVPVDTSRGYYRPVALTQDGKSLITRGKGGAIALWDVSTGTKTRELVKPYIGEPTAITLSPDGQSVVVGHYIKSRSRWTARAVEIRSGKEIWNIGGERGNVSFVGYSVDGLRVHIMHGGGGGVTIRDAKTSKETQSLSIDGPWESGKAIMSKDGRLAAVVMRTKKDIGGHLQNVGTIDLWDVEARKRLVQLDSGSSTVKSLAFSPDGEYIVTGGRELIAWNTKTGKRMLTLLEGAASVSAVAFSPDGKTLLAATGSKGVIRAFRAPTK